MSIQAQIYFDALEELEMQQATGKISMDRYLRAVNNINSERLD